MSDPTASESNVILYDILPNTQSPSRPYALLPNPWIARLLLKSKSIPFSVKPITTTELRARGPGSFQDRLGDSLGSNGRPLIPMIEHNGVLVGDNMTIADFLDKHYADSPSSYLPELTSAQAALPENQLAYQLAYHTARQLRNLVGSGHAELIYEKATERFDAEQRKWMRSDAKLGQPGAYDSFVARKRAELLGDTRYFLRCFFSILDPLPTARVEGVPSASSGSALGTVISRPQAALDGQRRLFLSSASKPGLLDFTVLGWYLFTYVNDRKVNEAIWSDSPAAARDWLDFEYKDGKDALQGHMREEGHWTGDVPLTNVSPWVERMLTLYDSYARKIAAGEVLAGEPQTL